MKLKALALSAALALASITPDGVVACEFHEREARQRRPIAALLRQR